MGAYPPFELTKSISRRKAGAQPGGLETSGGVGTTPSIPCRLASLVLLNLKMAGGLKVGSPTIGGQKLQTYKIAKKVDIAHVEMQNTTTKRDVIMV